MASLCIRRSLAVAHRLRQVQWGLQNHFSFTTGHGCQLYYWSWMSALLLVMDVSFTTGHGCQLYYSPWITLAHCSGALCIPDRFNCGMALHFGVNCFISDSWKVDSPALRLSGYCDYMLHRNPEPSIMVFSISDVNSAICCMYVTYPCCSRVGSTDGATTPLV